VGGIEPPSSPPLLGFNVAVYLYTILEGMSTNFCPCVLGQCL